MADYIDRVVTEDGETRALTPVMVRSITDTQHLPVPSNLIYDYIYKIAHAVQQGMQPKDLSEPMNFHGEVLTTVLDALRHIADYYTAVPASGSSKNYTAGGAYADKVNAPEQGSAKNLTAAGAFNDKETSPVEGSTKNYTAGGAFADKTDTPAYSDTRCLTAGGAYNFSVDAVISGSNKCFTAGGAYEIFAHKTTAAAWLQFVFGSDYAAKEANNYFID